MHVLENHLTQHAMTHDIQLGLFVTVPKACLQKEKRHDHLIKP